MLNIRSLLLVFFLLLTSVAATSHDVEIDEHVRLVPIPAYDSSDGEASGASALLAINTLLETFSDELKTNIQYELNAPERREWSNLPARNRPRPGVNIGTMFDEQRSLLFQFLSASLDEEGYHSIAETMAAEAFLATDPRASRFQWAPENFWLSIYGEPSNTSAWGWAFGGHHLAINISINNGKVVSMSPNFVGAEPSRFTVNGVEYDAIADMHQAGYVVYQSLTTEQKAAAAVVYTERDVMTGAGKDGFVPELEGVNVGGMTADQKALVMNAVNEWISHQPEENATPSMAEIESELDDTYFAWFGDIGHTSSSYFRIQGPSVIIELLGGIRVIGNSAESMGHYDTFYRDPTNDYGLGEQGF